MVTASFAERIENYLNYLEELFSKQRLPETIPAVGWNKWLEGKVPLQRTLFRKEIQNHSPMCDQTARNYLSVIQTKLLEAKRIIVKYDGAIWYYNTKSA